MLVKRLSVPGQRKVQHSSCGNIETHEALAVDATSVLEDDVFNSPPSASSRRRRLAAAVAAARAGTSPSPAVGSWMRPRLGSSVAGVASTSPPQISARDIRKVTLCIKTFSDEIFFLCNTVYTEEWGKEN